MSEHITIGKLMNTIDALTIENATLRGLVAKGQGDCVYCGLKAEDMAQCKSGFPGCARMDDIMAAQETEKDRQIDHLRMSLLNARMEAEAILDGIPNAVHVRESGGGENVFASLAVSVEELKNSRARWMDYGGSRL